MILFLKLYINVVTGKMMLFSKNNLVLFGKVIGGRDLG